MRCNLVIIALLLGLVVVAQTPNHNAVLITGDTPEGVAEKIQNALESGDTLYDSLGLWGFQEARKESVRYSYNEFWNDTYLMWELLYNKEWPDENIHVLYGDGEDYDQLNPRYQSPFPYDITDRPAYFADVKDVLEDLAYGDDSVGIEPMDSDDNLFCWTFDHGAGTTTRELILNKDFNVVSETYYPGYGLKHFLKDSLLYICLNDPVTDNGWLSILNIGEPSNPEKFVGCFETPDMVRDIIVDGNYAYITNKKEGVKILDISKPSSIKETDRYDPDAFTAMALDDVYYDTLHLLAVVNLINGIHWLNITQPDTFKYYSKADFFVGLGVGDLEVKDSIAFCCLGSNGIAVADFKNLITFYQWDNCDARDIAINDTLVYIADGENDFTILNIKEPDKIEFISNLNVPGTGNGLFYQSDTVYLAAGSAGIMTIDVSDPYSPSVINSYWPHNRRACDIEKSGSLLYTLFSGEHYPDVSLCLMGRPIMDREFASLINSITTNKGIFWMQQCHSGGFIDNLKGPNNIISTSCSIFESAYPADDKDIEGNSVIENEVLSNNKYFHGEYDFHIMNAVRQKKIWPYSFTPPYEPIDSSAYIWNRGTSMFECKTYVSHHDSRFILEGSEHPQFSDSGGIASSTYLEWDDLLPPAIPEGFIYRYKRETDYNWGIKLQWEDNDEVDMSGFYLYKNNILFDSTYKDTTYIDYDIDNYKGDTVQYGLSAFDLRGRESPQTDLSFTIPITISSTSSSTGYNNARRLLSYEHSIYLLYRSNNRVYCIISDDNGSTWGLPELVSDSSYTAKAPAGGVTEGGKIIAVWVRGNDKLMFSVRDNGVWSEPFEISLLLPHLDLQIHSLKNPGVAVTEDICHIFINGVW
ncbi:hypothetical protein KAW48_08200, partial [candidate division WOR-3 bacterium]|nr:hypothetical protein [candidate division WOR-3 bacterium]